MLMKTKGLKTIEDDANPSPLVLNSELIHLIKLLTNSMKL